MAKATYRPFAAAHNPSKLMAAMCRKAANMAEVCGIFRRRKRRFIGRLAKRGDQAMHGAGQSMPRRITNGFETSIRNG
jgi:hypothetical protein